MKKGKANEVTEPLEVEEIPKIVSKAKGEINNVIKIEEAYSNEDEDLYERMKAMLLDPEKMKELSAYIKRTK